MAERIAFVGGGNMALALATRLARAWPGAIRVADPVPAQRARFAPPVVTTPSNVAAVAEAKVVLFAVKPTVLDAVAREVAPALDDDALVLSIAAGVPIAAIERWVGGGRAVVRAMPNTPALIGKGITGLAANAAVKPAQRAAASAIMAAGGKVLWFKTDAELDAVTALSGSGPAYFFHVIETLASAGCELGLERDVAERLAVATAVGAATMAEAEAPATLRERVTSPGGTTERALSILAEKGFAPALRAAVRGACERARELQREVEKT